MATEQFEAGLKERTEVLGPEYVEKAFSSADNFNRDFQQIVTEYCWGGTWGRGVLDRKSRSILNLGMLAALGKSHRFFYLNDNIRERRSISFTCRPV